MDQAGAFFFGVFELSRDVIGRKGDVMNTFTVSLDEFGNRAVVGCGLKKFDVNITGGKKSGFYFLGFNFFAAFAFESENVFVIGDDFFE